MSTQVFECSVNLPASREDAFAWHTRPGALERLVPPWEKVQILTSDGSVRDGAKVSMRVPYFGPLKKTWVAQHYGYLEGVQFCDRQVHGPFAEFNHVHRFEEIDGQNSRLTDRIEFTPPLGLLGSLGCGMIFRRLKRAFAYRHRVLVSDFKRHSALRGQPRLKIAISGSTGLIGSALVPFLTTGGHHVTKLVRSIKMQPVSDGTTTVLWNPDHEKLPDSSLEGMDAVIHLAGESIATGRWTDAKKQRIRTSRVNSTALLAKTLAKLQHPPRVFFCASAVGYYPMDGGDRSWTERDDPGDHFLADVCKAWEEGILPAQHRGIRSVSGRFGVVLSGQGGALTAQLPLFKLGLAGRLGSGRQYVPWITIDDLIGAIYHCIMRDEIQGPVNLTAPNPVTNREFTKTLGRMLSRPTILPAPAFALRLALGEMADSLLLASLRVIPERLMETGFSFDYPELGPALGHLLGRSL